MNEDLHLTSHTLIERLKNVTDNVAWTEFQEFYWEIVTGWAMRLGCSQALSKDVFQETMLNLFKNMPNFELRSEKGAFRSYLKTIVSRRVHDAYRREKKYVLSNESESELNWIDNIKDDKEDVVEEDTVWVHSILSQALRQSYKKIDESTYKSFCLYVLDGLPVKEVASKLSIKEGTIYQQKSRFLLILKKEFCKLLYDLGEDLLDEKFINKDSEALTKTLEEMLKDKADFRETIIQNQPPTTLMGQIEFVRQALNLNDKCLQNALLIFKTESPENGEWHILKKNNILGRSTDCNIILKADGVSSIHSIIKYSNKSYVLSDDNSTNGTFVNGKKISQPRYLCDGDVIQISSKYSMIVNLSDK